MLKIVSYSGELLSCFAFYTKYMAIARTASEVSIATLLPGDTSCLATPSELSNYILRLVSIRRSVFTLKHYNKLNN